MMFSNKKAMVNLYERWVEWVSFGLLIIGLFLGLWSGSKVVTYLVILLCGIIFGRNMFIKRFGHKIIFYVMMFAFLIGFVLGSFYGKTSVIVVLFIIGMISGYWLNKKEYI